ncbi:unnamed protein product [Owenia fusiformis]|uniref:Serine/threonine-protein phosphatase PGAM5, mitochondrial n=1 Tax=Owenia fusiformis TaxID=6347 RepID=A0A8S4Q6U2_OWEFU|nr:unnamed protein product [Owenia fusiformis]
MRWIHKGKPLFDAASIVSGAIVGGVAVAVAWVYSTKDGPDAPKYPFQVTASWTTNSEPSVKWDHNWDKRDPESKTRPKKNNEDEIDYEKRLAKNKPTATRHLFLIRHGQYNLEGITDFERKLTALGKEQADFTGLRLSLMKQPWTKLISSTMTRAKETADIITKHLPEDVPRDYCDFLREGAPIPPEPPVGHWRPEHQDGSRIEAAFRKYFHRADADQLEDSYEILVCHANVIRYFVCRGLQFPPEAWLRISLNNGSITHMYIRPNGRVGIRYMGESGHMPVEKVTST